MCIQPFYIDHRLIHCSEISKPVDPRFEGALQSLARASQVQPVRPVRLERA